MRYNNSAKNINSNMYVRMHNDEAALSDSN